MIWPLRTRRLTLDDAVLTRLTVTQPWLARLGDAERMKLCALIAEFLSIKAINGAQGLIVTDEMRIAIAAQACLPVLHLGLAHYGDFSEIVVHAGAFEVHREHTDAFGLVTELDEVLAGESIDGGPVVLSWEDVSEPGFSIHRANVVIHEFAHKLDLADGLADGCPPMPATSRRRWLACLEAAYEQFCIALDDLESSIPADIDPESEQADAWYKSLPLDPYAATDPCEFFAVAAERHFTDPQGFASAFPELHDCFVTFFQQSPHCAADTHG